MQQIINNSKSFSEMDTVEIRRINSYSDNAYFVGFFIDCISNTIMGFVFVIDKKTGYQNFSFDPRNRDSDICIYSNRTVLFEKHLEVIKHYEMLESISNSYKNLLFL